MRCGIDMTCLAMYVDIRSKRWPDYGFWLYIFGPFARRIFSVCGSLGVFEYLGFLSDSVFKDSHLFPIAITAEGLASVIFGF